MNKKHRGSWPPQELWRYGTVRHEALMRGKFSSAYFVVDPDLFLEDFARPVEGPDQVWRHWLIFAWCFDRLIEVERLGTTNVNIGEILVPTEMERELADWLATPVHPRLRFSGTLKGTWDHRVRPAHMAHMERRSPVDQLYTGGVRDPGP